jgi:glycosyltransferase involved in cell wall biosynthesis
MDGARRAWHALPVPTAARTALFVARQLCWRASRAPLGIVYRRHEDREVARVRALLGPVPTARVVTVIATYRRPEGLVAAVRSALAQTVSDQLVVVVDDGGGLPELPLDERVVAIRLSRNYGCLGMVRNVGVRVSQSRYVAFLDDDNTWTPDHLAVSLAAHRDGVDATYTALHRVLPDGSTYDTLSVPFDRWKVLARNPADSNALVLRRRADVIFSRIPKLKEDWALVQRLSRKGRCIVHVPVPTVHYLINPASYYSAWARPTTRR